MTGDVGKVKEPKKIVVVGAGIGGMCAAARLARAGHSVEIYEASDRPGGKCRTEWIGRYAFDTGPSLLTIPAVYRDFFQRTGKHMGQVLELEAVDPSFDYRFHDGKSVQFTNLSRKKTLESITESFGAEAAEQWNAVLNRAERMWDVSREPFVESELKSPLSLLKRRHILRDLRIIAPRATLRDFGLSNPYLAKIMDRYATYSGSDPRKAPAVLSTIAFIEEAFGAWHIKGGIGTLSEHIAERCEKVGAKIHLNSPIASIDLKGNKAVGITLVDGRKIVADIVISNADAGLTYNKLISKPTRRVRKVRKELSKLEPSLAGFSLLLGLRPSDQPKLSHHTILFPDDYDAEFESIFTAKKPVEKPTIYICSPNDPAMVKSEGHEALFILVNASRHSENSAEGFDWSNKEFNQRYANSIIDQIEAQGILIRDRLDLLEIRTPLDLQNSVHAPGGSIYGTSSNGPRAAFLRAKNRSPLKNLYLVGGSSHPGGGLPLVGLSAEIVANAVLANSK
ncbi:COG1233 Phytoene dehydrogenase and related proteins [Candidatus Nanopelagicaceae bacterium]